MTWDDFGIVADVASIIGLALTLFVYIKLRQLWRMYALTERVPREAARLRSAAGRLSQWLIPDPPRDEVLKVLAEMKVALESIDRNIGTEHGKSYSELKKEIIKAERENPFSQSKLEKIYSKSILLVGRAESLAEDRKQRLSP